MRKKKELTDLSARLLLRHYSYRSLFMGNDGTEPCDFAVSGIERIKLAHHTPGVVSDIVRYRCCCNCMPRPNLRYVAGQP